MALEAAGAVLVLRRRSVDELMKSDPSCAAEVLFALARVLADRQYALATFTVVNQSTGRPARASPIAGWISSRHGSRPKRSTAKA